MLKENMTLTAIVNAVLTDAKGNIKKEVEVKNLVTNLGLAYFTSRAISAAQNVISHMAVGSGSTAPSGANTTLVTEMARVALTSATQVTTTVANDSVQYVATFGSGVATGVIQEAGLLNASSTGTLTNRTVFGTITKDAGDTLTITWKVTIS
jgi:hypothetical protein